jgi:hypothetical protein
MAVYGLGYHPQNIIWTEVKLRSIYNFVDDRPVHKLPFGGPSIDASYQVSVHLAERFQRRRLKCEKLTDAK